MLDIEFVRNCDSFFIRLSVFGMYDLSDNAIIADFCAIPLTFHGIFIFCKISMIFLFPMPYPIRSPASPNDFVSDRRIKRLSNSRRCDMTLSFVSGTSSIKHSSRNTIADLSYADSIMRNTFCFFKRDPVGLLGLHKKTQFFAEIMLLNSSKSLFRSIVLKKWSLALCSFAADSYSLNVGIGISTFWFF